MHRNPQKYVFNKKAFRAPGRSGKGHVKTGRVHRKRY